MKILCVENVGNRYKYIDSKEITDFDGFLTEYTMYYDTEEDRYVFVFGDGDLYNPNEDEYMDFDYECESKQEATEWFNDYNGFEDYDESLHIRHTLVDEKISDQDYSQSKTGKAYKVFKFKDGKLYPPMVANPGGEDTPTGVWLDAEEGEFAGLSKTGRKRVKSTGSGTLAYRPGWHLGEEPIASQFDRKATYTEVEPTEDVFKAVANETAFAKKYCTETNEGKIFYIKDTDKYVQVIVDGKPHFPYDFVWAECDYVMDIDYQEKAMSYGYTDKGKFQHSLAGLPELPKGGYYKYRTNPRPDTVPWELQELLKLINY